MQERNEGWCQTNSSGKSRFPTPIFCTLTRYTITVLSVHDLCGLSLASPSKLRFSFSRSGSGRRWLSSFSFRPSSKQHTREHGVSSGLNCTVHTSITLPTMPVPVGPRRTLLLLEVIALCILPIWTNGGAPPSLSARTYLAALRPDHMACLSALLSTAAMRSRSADMQLWGAFSYRTCTREAGPGWRNGNKQQGT